MMSCGRSREIVRKRYQKANLFRSNLIVLLSQKVAWG
jgi:hypothetical protein